MQPQQTVPQQLTTFIGRQKEIQDITDLLADPHCRLLTLLGPGGIGKTRLAVQVTAVVTDHFRDGVTFINCRPVPSPLFFLPTIAEAFGLSLTRQTTPDIQLQTYLQDKELLLILDNVEHLLAGVEALSMLLQTAPRLKLLATSREVLNLQEEWQYPVGGLPIPPDSHEPEWQQYPAIQLFRDRARRVRPSFELITDAADIIRICRLVDGTPLALELAASWTKTLSCQAIAQEIQENITFLATNLRNIPERHRSIRAVFEQAWQQLSAAEQAVFKRLSVFQNGFLLDAAQTVAGATLANLSALVNKSLLRWDPGEPDNGRHGRYQTHELLRQYAAHHLADNPEEAQTTFNQHTAYYCHFLQAQNEALIDERQIEAVQAIKAEIENIRAALTHAYQENNISLLHQAVFAYHTFCDYQSRFLEFTNTYLPILDQLKNNVDTPENALAAAEINTMLGWSFIRMGQFDEARTAFEQSQALYQAQQQLGPAGFGNEPLSGLALLADIVGEYQASLDYCRQARHIAEQRHDSLSMQIIWYVEADVYLSLGQLTAAWQAGRQGYEATKQTNNYWMMANMLIVLGNIARAKGDLDQAHQHFQASYELKDAVNDPEGMAVAVIYLARIALRQGRYDDAWQLYQQDLAVYREIDDQGGLVRTLQGAGETAVARGDVQTALTYYYEALLIAKQMQWEPFMLSLIVNIAALLHTFGEAAAGLELAALVQAHPASEQETKNRAADLSRTLQKALSAETYSRQLAKGETADLNTVSRRLLTELETRPWATTTAQPQSAHPLVEALTPRELEVLQLIADGLSNRAIAEELVIAIGTVKSYTNQIYNKLGVSSRTQAVATARELGVLI